MGEYTLDDVMKAIKAMNDRFDQHEERINKQQFQYNSIGDEVSKLKNQVRFNQDGDDEAVSSSFVRHSHSKSKENDIKLNDLPEFDGDKDPDVFLDWERRMERLFDHKHANDATRFSYAILKLTNTASLWYETMQDQRKKEEKPRINSWKDLRVKMRKRFVPSTYKQQLYIELNSLEQKYNTVQQYIHEFDKLYMACGCKDDEEQKIAKFILGLHPTIRDKVELQSFSSYDEACLLATKIERQHNKSSSKFSWFKTNTTIPPEHNATDFPKENQTEYSTKPEPQKNVKDTSKQVEMPKWFTDKGAAKKTVCFRCQGQGHVQKDCPNKFLITEAEHILHMEQRKIEKANEEEEELDAYPEDDSKMLILHANPMKSDVESVVSVSSDTPSQHKFKPGDYVYLTKGGEDKYYSQSTYAPPLEEGPYKVLKPKGKGRYKVMLGVRNNFTFHASDLVQFDDDVYPP